MEGKPLKLFEPMAIKNMKVKNRIVMPPMQLALGVQNPRVRAYYLERAKGGAGNIMMAAISVDLFIDDEAWGRAGGAARLVDSMKSFTAEIKQTGAVVGIQLWHGNRLPAGTGAANLPGGEQVAPSARDGMREFSADEIRSVIEKFARAAEKVKASGFDYVELHGAHRYLLCQFFSGADNQRTDEFGGDVYGRMRVGLEAVKATREAVGDDYPIFFRIGAEEKRPGGVTIEESGLYAESLEKAGVDVMDVSVGGEEDGHRAAPGKKAEPGTYVYLAEAIKQKVSIPVIGVGKINTPDLAESILKDGRADLIAIGRQLIADPFWPHKVMEGRSDEIVACESCNTCFSPLRSGKWKPGDPVCKVNPRAGREIDMPLPD
jgi:2,4-dienoyl-CoA reductase-like NADH-dependent reductase (Old Yellow Enzyme family)